MGETTAIEWSDATVNFWRGCDKVSPGCAHCYMFTAQRRYGRDPAVVTRCSPATFRAPLSQKWRRRAAEIAEREGRRMRVFTCSWSDFFHEGADAWREEAWEIIRACPEYDWQILTKRPELIADRLPSWWGDADCEAPENVWLGVSIENRRFVDRADVLRGVPAAVRFISAEPLLGPLVHDTDVGMYNDCSHSVCDCPKRLGDPYTPCWSDEYEGPELDLTDIDWLIVGGESGPGHRRMDPWWVESLRDACETTAFFFKQWGGATSKAGGRLLDGREWSEMPILGGTDVSSSTYGSEAETPASVT